MERLPQRDDIQGLRAIAVLAVIVFHLNKEWLPGGFTGVDIFLVISGFLITSIILRQQRDGSFLYSSFYISRIRRIVPAYLALLAVTTFCMAVLLTPNDFVTYEKSLVAASYFGSNHFFANQSDYFAPAAHELPLLHTWSLAVEMQFYLLLPLLLKLLPRRFSGAFLTVLIAALVAHSSYRLALGERQAEYFSLTSRVHEFLIGSLVAISPASRDWPGRGSNLAATAGLLLIVGGFFFISEETPFPGLLSLVPCLGSALVIAAGSRSVVGQWLTNPLLVLVGALSYSLYLWHWPILAAIRYFLEAYALPPAAVLAFVVLTLTLSYGSYRYVELPFRGRSAPSGFRSVALLVTAVSLIGLANIVGPRLVDPLPAELTRYARDEEICHGRVIGDCIRGERSADREILLIGDSHGAQLNLFADVVGQSLHARIRVLTASSCVPIDDFDVDRPVEWARAPCLRQIEVTRTYIPLARGLIVAGMWQYHFKSEKFLQALDRFLDDAAKRNQSVVVLAQVPMLESNVVRRFRFEQLGLPQSRVERHPEWRAANQRIRDLVARHPLATFFDATEDPLFRDAPFEDGVLLYHDSHHLNEVGSRRYAEVASPRLSTWFVGIFTNGERP
jgi:peptidoglycan/LPS O-acetylase OafA/YrhL